MRLNHNSHVYGRKGKGIYINKNIRNVAKEKYYKSRTPLCMNVKKVITPCQQYSETKLTYFYICYFNACNIINVHDVISCIPSAVVKMRYMPNISVHSATQRRNVIV